MQSHMLRNSLSCISSLAYVVSRILKKKSMKVRMAQTMEDSFNPWRSPFKNMSTSQEALLSRRTLRSLNSFSVRRTVKSVSAILPQEGKMIRSTREPSTHSESTIFH
ncbi:unnamed protein product [Prorocentrum cordatum]|uniref:Uncharacterized protein n=1 Tax=Prorocentrum cordatum TaxID=2364126 RepID=A0ABN9TTN3_9DINO|nr:unnamed protein product [Polarella glacialis]